MDFCWLKRLIYLFDLNHDKENKRVQMRDSSPQQTMIFVTFYRLVYFSSMVCLELDIIIENTKKIKIIYSFYLFRETLGALCLPSMESLRSTDCLESLAGDSAVLGLINQEFILTFIFT